MAGLAMMLLVVVAMLGLYVLGYLLRLDCTPMTAWSDAKERGDSSIMALLARRTCAVRWGLPHIGLCDATALCGQGSSTSSSIFTRDAAAAREQREAAQRRTVLCLAAGGVALLFLFLLWQIGGLKF